MRRHPQFTDETREKIYEDLRNKGDKETAALAGGISMSTLKSWIKKGETLENRWAEQGMTPDPVEQEYIDFVIEYRRADYEGRLWLRDVADSLLTTRDGNRPDVALLKMLLDRKRVYPDAVPLEDTWKNPGGSGARILGIVIQEQPRLPEPSPANEDYIEVEVKRVEKEEETD
jgi:hypothetical protein